MNCPNELTYTLNDYYLYFDRSPATRQGDNKLVYRLIQLFSSTEIFSKRRKVYACWRKTRVTEVQDSDK